jgi:hypothetical protein
MIGPEAKIEGNGQAVITVKLFDGRTFQIDFKKTSLVKIMTSDGPLIDWTANLLDRAMWDNLILSGLRPTLLPPGLKKVLDK